MSCKQRLPQLVFALVSCILGHQHSRQLKQYMRGKGEHSLHVLQADARGTTRSAVAALLDGATPLHAAALRGNPAQIDHLLFCKADPMARTAAGDYPFELVPICADKVSGTLYIVSHIPAFQVCCVLSLTYLQCF